MPFNKPKVLGHDSAMQPIQAYGFVVANGASNPTVFGGVVANARRLVTAGAVPFLRVTLKDGVNLSKVAIGLTLNSNTFGHMQVTSLTSTVAGTPTANTEFDIRFFDAAAADIEPIASARVYITILGDR